MAPLPTFIAAGLLSSTLLAQVPCTPTIANESLTPAIPGVVNTINFYDDLSGAGPQFFAAGTIASMGNVARLTPTGWQQVGPGLPNAVYTLDVIDDGTGPNNNLALYAGGDFGLARWNGTTWDMFVTNVGQIFAIVMYDDGTGPTLYGAGGLSIFKKTATSWITVAGVDPYLLSQGPTDRLLVLDDDGPGPRLPSIFYANARAFGPSFNPSNTVTTSGVVRYNPSTLEGLPGDPVGFWVKSATVFDDGIIGPALYIAGHRQAQNQTTIVRWNPATSTWANVGPPLSTGDAAYALTVFADGAAPRPRLYAIAGGTPIGVSPSSNIAAWDGQTWTPIWNRPCGGATSMNYHFPSRAGTLGAANIPALLYAGMATSSSTTLYAIVGCPRCPGDVDLDGHVTIADLFLYLNAWFANQLSSDLGGNGQTTQDILDFLNGWLTPCS
jgi:hypothetical protein